MSFEAAAGPLVVALVLLGLAFTDHVVDVLADLSTAEGGPEWTEEPRR